MSSMDNEMVRRGYFKVVRNPRDGMLKSLNSVSSKRQWVVLRKQSRGNPTTIELYKSEDQTVAPVRTIPLDRRNFKRVTTNERKKAFSLNLNDEVCVFQCSSRADMEDWYRDIETYTSEMGGGVDPGRVPLQSINSTNSDDFSGIPDDETFQVRLRKSNTIVFSGPCLLEILKDFENNKFHIALFTKEEAPRLIVKWQIDHIRQYGSHQSAFKFESGRKSSTGVDWFILDTEVGAAVRIHRSVDYWAKHIVEQVTNRGEPPVHRRASAAPITNGVTSPTTIGPPLSKPYRGSGIPMASSVPVTSSLPGGSQGVYQPLGRRDQLEVYEVPDRPGQSPTDKNKQGKPLAKPPPTNEGASLYQPLTHGTATNNGHSVYQQLNQDTRTSAGPRVPSLPQPVRPQDPTYMGLNPQTQTISDVYMGLDQARS